MTLLNFLLVNANPEGYNQYTRGDNAKMINEHLAGGGVVAVTTGNRTTLYDKRHSGHFSEGEDGHLYVKRGRGKDSLGPAQAPYVKVKFGRMQ